YCIAIVQKSKARHLKFILNDLKNLETRLEGLKNSVDSLTHNKKENSLSSTNRANKMLPSSPTRP
ncbi:MAG: hypothetical protein AAF963_02715, partial [Bacteroidota bacterium]